MNFPSLPKRKVGQPVIYAQKTLGTPRNLDQRVKQLEETASGLNPPPFDHAEHLDKSRSKIALRFVRWYLFFVFIIIVGVPLYNRYAVGQKDALDVYKMLTQVGTLLGTPLGFVVGYYFKEENGKK